MEKKQRKSKIPYIVLAVVVLAVLLLLLTIIYYSLLKPHNPQLTVIGVDLENPIQNPEHTSLAKILKGIALRMNMSLHNPNRGPFYYAKVGTVMLYKGRELGYGMVPGGKVKGKGGVGFAMYVAAVETAVSSSEQVTTHEGPTASLEMVTVETNVRTSGAVTVLGSFSHHTSMSISCLVSISSITFEVVTFICGF